MDEELKKSIVKTGTTTLGLVCKDGIILAADKRATFGGLFISHKRIDKLLPITDKVYVTTAGSVADIQLMIKLTKAEIRLKILRTKMEPSIKEIASLFGMLVYENIRKFSPILGITAFLIGGVDNKGFWLFDIGPDGSALERKDFVSTGSGSVVAYGVLEDSYREGLSIDDGVKLAVKSINAAMQRDTPTGSGIDVVVIDKNGARKVIEEEVKQVFIKK